MKLAVIFPGIGYHTDKPLLYYAKQLAKEHGYNPVEVPYKNFPRKVRGDREKMIQSFEIAASQTEDLLENVDFEAAENILFISKSVGTIVAAHYAEKHGLEVRHIIFTPLADTFTFLKGSGIAFHGTADPWADTGEIREACRKYHIPLYTFEGANHSIETDHIMTDLIHLSEIMEICDSYMAAL